MIFYAQAQTNTEIYLTYIHIYSIIAVVVTNVIPDKTKAKQRHKSPLRTFKQINVTPHLTRDKSMNDTGLMRKSKRAPLNN